MVHPSWSDYPHLLADLDMAKNKNHKFGQKGIHIDVLELIPTTSKKLDWKCIICEHEWKGNGDNRVRGGSGCAACSGRGVHSDGRNSMAMTHPTLAVEYQGDATKLIAGTHKKLDWKCITCEHEWNASAKSRSSVQRNGCPACAGHLHSDGRNSMFNTHPDLAKEYLGDSNLIIAGTNNNLDWNCSTCDHIWTTQGCSRVGGSGCAPCNRGDLHSEGINSMANTHPKLAKEYQGDANLIIAGTNKILDWKCITCEHTWKVRGADRASGNGCPSCANRVRNSFDNCNSMANTHPELAKEYQGDANLIMAGTYKKLDWKCITCEHEWNATGSGRASSRKSGCPACVNQSRNSVDARNSMANTHPKLAKEYQGDANLIMAGTNKKLDWKCITCNHEWKTSGSCRVSGNGCPPCNRGDFHSDGRNSMANTHPKLAKEYQGDANLIIAGNHKKLDWKCFTCDHVWKATGNDRANGGTGCPSCVNRVLNNFDNCNSMANTHPKLAKEYQGDANLIMAGTGKKIDWKCITCEHEWKVRGADRVNGRGCPACSNKVINNFDGRNSMANTHPNLAVEYQGDATLIVAGTNKILDWKCITCEYTWKVGGNDRASGNGCSACANSGYDPSKIGYVYIHQYIDETNHWLKCGITGKPTDRFKQLSRAASRVNIEVEQLDIYTFDDGWIAQQCERELLDSLELRFNSEYDIEGKAEFFKYSALEEIKNIIEKYL